MVGVILAYKAGAEAWKIPRSTPEHDLFTEDSFLGTFGAREAEHGITTYLRRTSGPHGAQRILIIRLVPTPLWRVAAIKVHAWSVLLYEEFGRGVVIKSSTVK